MVAGRKEERDETANVVVVVTEPPETETKGKKGGGQEKQKRNEKNKNIKYDHNNARNITQYAEKVTPESTYMYRELFVKDTKARKTASFNGPRDLPPPPPPFTLKTRSSAIEAVDQLASARDKRC